MKAIFLVLGLSITLTHGAPQKIIVGVHPGLSYPDYERVGSNHRGIIPALFDSFGQAKGYQVVYKVEPRKRMDELVASGEIHARCLVAKSWVENKDEFLWSHKIFRERSTFVRLKTSPEIKDFSDLKGKSFAGILGFIYGPELTSMVAKGELERFNVIKVKNLLKMVKLKRADVAIESQRVLEELIKDQDDFYMTVLIQGKADLYCLFSKKIPGVNSEKLRDEFNNHFTDKVIKEVLSPFGLPYRE